MKEYKALLFDLDDTILSFSKAEDYAIKSLCKEYNIPIKKENIDLYKTINMSYWHKLEKKEITREYLLENRFKEFFNEIGILLNDYTVLNDKYFNYLTSKVFYIKGSVKALRKLKNKYKLYLITNGLKTVQERRLKLASDIKELMDDIFISEEVGYVKPSKGFMDYTIEKTGFKKEEMLIIGDSLSSDMALGIENGVDVCHFNKGKNKENEKITYSVTNFKQIEKLLL